MKKKIWWVMPGKFRVLLLRNPAGCECVSVCVCVRWMLRPYLRCYRRRRKSATFIESYRFFLWSRLFIVSRYCSIVGFFFFFFFGGGGVSAVLFFCSLRSDADFFSILFHRVTVSPGFLVMTGPFFLCVSSTASFILFLSPTVWLSTADDD